MLRMAVIPFPASARLDVVAVDQFLVAQEEAAIDDDRVDPDAALGFALFGLGGEREAAFFLPAGFRGFHEDDVPFLFRDADEMTGHVGAAAFAECLVLPDWFARQEILAGPAAFVRVAVEFSVHEDDAAVVIHHFIAFVDEFRGIAAEFEHAGTHIVSGCHVDMIIVVDGSGDDGNAAREVALPEGRSVFRAEAEDFFADELDDLFFASVFDEDGRGILGFLGDVL